MDKDLEKAIELVESKHKCFDNTLWLMHETASKLQPLIHAKKLDLEEEIQLANNIYLLKRLAMLYNSEQKVDNILAKRRKSFWYRIFSIKHQLLNEKD